MKETLPVLGTYVQVGRDDLLIVDVQLLDGSEGRRVVGTGGDCLITVDGESASATGLLGWLREQPYGSVQMEWEASPHTYGVSNETHFRSGPSAKKHTTRQEVVEGVTAYVERKFGGDWKKAFDHHDADGDGRLTTTEVVDVLSVAGVGLRITRRLIAMEIVKVIDADGDGYITFSEFQSMVN